MTAVAAGVDVAPALRVEGPAQVIRRPGGAGGIDLTVAEHEVVCLIGSSGSGEVDVAALHQRARGGQRRGGSCVDGARVHGAAASTSTASGAEFGIVFQSFNLFPHMTVLRNVTLAPAGAGSCAEPRPRRAMELLGPGEPGRESDEYPDRLSGGQQHGPP